jgi:hypothetical protein
MKGSDCNLFSLSFYVCEEGESEGIMEIYIYIYTKEIQSLCSSINITEGNQIKDNGID